MRKTGKDGMTGNQKAEVWVFVEQRGGIPAEVSLELLSKGRKLAETLKGVLKSVVVGHRVSGVAERTFRYGAVEALTADHPDLEHYRTLPYSRILNELIVQRKPRIVLFGATVVGRDLAPRVSSFTKSGLTADCTDLQISDVKYLRKDYKDLLLQVRPAFGGNIIATIISPGSPTQMATVREGVMEDLPLDKPVKGKIAKVAFSPTDTDSLVRIVERHEEERRVNLKAAGIIIAGGYGMGSRENFGLLYDLAHLIGGEVAGTRAAVDAGFIEAERQVGQTGITVRPKLYIAAGISGAVQHTAGMDRSQKIIAINKDPEAPIFDVCHYGIVGDVADVIPKFIEAYRETLR